MIRCDAVTHEDVGTTPRKALTRTQRLSMIEAHKRICILCGRKIEAGEAWTDEHIVPLAMGGSNDLSNRGPAHKPCALAKTNGPDGDLAQAAKAKRVKMRFLGISDPKRRKIQSAGFEKAPPQRRASSPSTKPSLPPRPLYVER